MKILINCSNLNVGGGVQVALSFLHEISMKKLDHEFYLLSSAEIDKQIDDNVREKIEVTTWVDKKKLNAFFRHQWLVKNENRIKPDIVFTVFGPSYWKPKAFHVEGFATVWLLYPNSVVYELLSQKQYFQKKIQNYIKKVLFSYETDCLVVETNEAKIRLKKVLKNNSKVYVVGNTFSQNFTNKNKYSFPLPKREKNEFRFITITNNYIHKNLRILNQVVPLLRDNQIKVKFFLTISNKEYEEIFSTTKDYVYNLGPISQKYCPDAYKQVDALFLPTLLEVYTASYPEAMVSGIPIITSDLGFAHDICQKAALYVDPMSAEDIYKNIVYLIDNPQVQEELVNHGYNRLDSLNSSENRANQYMSILEENYKLNEAKLGKPSQA